MQSADDLEGQRQVQELAESADFVRSCPESFKFFSRNIFNGLDANQNNQISWREIQDSFLGNVEKLPFQNKHQLRDCFDKWATIDGNASELNFEEFCGFLKDLMDLLSPTKKETSRRRSQKK
ncbi:uncharacterized protein LOC134843765 [Symsagittifera roscoffensis]|uniref:uncharacterized protein LOC134843765 n=1 Tax=Symsagittifera roscoffensis TaxID=84072 RepID=UPI00307B894B